MPEEYDTLLPSFQREKRIEKELFENEDEDEYSPTDKLYNLINKKRRELNSDLIQKHFRYLDLETILKSLD